MTILCPVAGKPGKKVQPVTLRSLVREEFASDLENRTWFFCGLPDCDVVYFSSDGRTIPKTALKVRVGKKEKEAPHPVCYCFGHTVESIREEIERTGRTTVVESITAKVKAGECSCETSNPKGSCCLRDVNQAVKEAFAVLARRTAAPEPALAAPGAHACCGPASSAVPGEETRRPGRSGLLATVASIVSAIIASACCWLPLALLAFGTSAAGLSAAFERVRPIFLGLAALLLGTGFYFVYFRREACAPDGTCTTPSPKIKRFSRVMLWIATAVVIAIAFFPNYVGLLLPRGPEPSTPSAPGKERAMTLRIEGMTCEGCATHLERVLAALPGVRRASLAYGEKRATLVVDSAAGPPVTVLMDAVLRAGYRAQVQPDP